MATDCKYIRKTPQLASLHLNLEEQQLIGLEIVVYIAHLMNYACNVICQEKTMSHSSLGD